MSNTCSFWLSIELKKDDKQLINEKKFLKLLQNNHLLSVKGEGDDVRRCFSIESSGDGEGFHSFFEVTKPEVFEGELLFFNGDCKSEITPKQFLGLKDAFCALAKKNDIEIVRISMQGENQMDYIIQRYEYPLPNFLRPSQEEITEEIDRDDFDSENEYKDAIKEKQNEYLGKYCLLTFSTEDIEEQSLKDDEWLWEHIEALEEALSQCANKISFDELYSPLPIHYYVYDELGEEDDYDIWEPEEEEEEE
ncbi:MAG: hypothetical protein IKP00_02235, partial [Victivallales bacterium]|nr:hypothetical protein [Victivallales bacterium]